ncbi:MAG: DUF1285 domain-containing protein [Oleispira antarctica]|uniref:DUF1285 domain-containing protein n=1 Tax=Oleispira antarctica RB-8 TaxID=698738 RepID=R4YMU1_OLEAN|nr:DUF1285 domain-containing protein [Oleispira antarctica]CCK76070.1 conserved hypothetical protein [Oleispira antarctica RB-8]
MSSDKDLFKLLGKFEREQKMPPVENWDPKVESDIDIVIDSQGRWFHEGGHFDRQDLARMFASILRKEGQSYFLVTPAEKLKITVEDVPFSIVLMKAEVIGDQQQLTFITSLGDEVAASTENKIEFRANEAGDQIPYIEVRNNLWGKLNQSTYYELMDLVEERPEGFFLTSGGSEVKIPD